MMNDEETKNENQFNKPVPVEKIIKDNQYISNSHRLDISKNPLFKGNLI